MIAAPPASRPAATTAEGASRIAAQSASERYRRARALRTAAVISRRADSPHDSSGRRRVGLSAVVAALHPKWDERPLLLVVARPGHTVDPASVLQMYQGQVPKWWLPEITFSSTSSSAAR